MGKFKNWINKAAKMISPGYAIVSGAKKVKDTIDENVGQGAKKENEQKINDALAAIEKNFEKQWEFLEGREELWDQYREAAEAALDNSPEYEIPNVIKELTTNLQNTADAVRDNYSSASGELKDTIAEGVNRSLETYMTNLNEALDTVKQGGQAGLKNFQEAYDVANKSASDLLSTGKDGFDSIMNLAKVGGNEYKQIVEDGLNSYMTGAKTSADKIRDMASTGANNMLSAGQKGVDTTIQGLDDALSGYQQGAKTIRDITQDTLNQSQESSDSALSESLKGTDEMLNIYRDLAGGTMPGQSLLEGKLDQESAEALTRIKELSGGRGGLSSIAKTFQNKQEGLQDIAIQAAQYKTQMKQNLAQAYGQAGQMRSSAYTDKFNRDMNRGQFGINAEGMATEMGAGSQERIALQKGNAFMTQAELEAKAAEMGISAEQLANSIQSEADLNALNARTGASQYATGLNMDAELTRTTGMMDATTQASNMQTNALNNLGQAKFANAEMVGNQMTNNANRIYDANMEGTKMNANAIITGANMVNQGQIQGAALESEAANTMAAYEDQAFQFNEWQPYQNKLNYNANMVAQTDPMGYQMELMGDEAGVELAKYQGALNAENARKLGNTQLMLGLLNTIGKTSSAFI